MKISKPEVKRIKRFGDFAVGGSVDIDIEEQVDGLKLPFKMHITANVFVTASKSDQLADVEDALVKKASIAMSEYLLSA